MNMKTLDLRPGDRVSWQSKISDYWFHGVVKDTQEPKYLVRLDNAGAKIRVDKSRLVKEYQP